MNSDLCLVPSLRVQLQQLDACSLGVAHALAHGWSTVAEAWEALDADPTVCGWPSFAWWIAAMCSPTPARRWQLLRCAQRVLQEHGEEWAIFDRAHRFACQYLIERGIQYEELPLTRWVASSTNLDVPESIEHIAWVYLYQACWDVSPAVQETLKSDIPRPFGAVFAARVSMLVDSCYPTKVCHLGVSRVEHLFVESDRQICRAWVRAALEFLGSAENAAGLLEAAYWQDVRFRGPKETIED